MKTLLKSILVLVTLASSLAVAPLATAGDDARAKLEADFSKHTGGVPAQ